MDRSSSTRCRSRGPVGDVDTGRALLVVHADSEDAVRERLAGDPWPEDLLTIESVERWSISLRRAP